MITHNGHSTSDNASNPGGGRFRPAWTGITLLVVMLFLWGRGASATLMTIPMSATIQKGTCQVALATSEDGSITGKLSTAPQTLSVGDVASASTLRLQGGFSAGQNVLTVGLTGCTGGQDDGAVPTVTAGTLADAMTGNSFIFKNTCTTGDNCSDNRVGIVLVKNSVPHTPGARMDWGANTNFIAPGGTLPPFSFGDSDAGTQTNVQQYYIALSCGRDAAECHSGDANLAQGKVSASIVFSFGYP